MPTGKAPADSDSPTTATPMIAASACETSPPSLTRPRLSVVVPCFNEAPVLQETCKQLLQVLDRLTHNDRIHADSQIVFVDDGSSDDTWLLIKSLHLRDSRIRGIKLSANQGHQTALIAGLFAAEGDAIVSIDADLQDDVNAIDSMVNAFSAGHDIVYGVRRSRNTDTLMKRSTAVWYYRLLRALGVNVLHNHADYRLLSRRALESLKGFSEVNLFLRGIIPLLGYPSSVVYYDRLERFAGESKYPFRKMIALAANGVTSFTAAPLRMIALLGILVSLLSAGMVAWVLAVRLFTTQAIPGWASSVIPIYFLGGLQLLSIGVVGEYVARIYFESKRRPRYFVEQKI